MSIVMTAPVVDYKIHWLKMMSVPGKPSHRWEARWNKWKGQVSMPSCGRSGIAKERAQRDWLLYSQVKVLPAQFSVWCRSHIRQASGATR